MSASLQNGIAPFTPIGAVGSNASVIGIGGKTFGASQTYNSGSSVGWGAKPFDLPMGMTYQDLETAYRSGAKIETFDPITKTTSQIEITGMQKNNLPGGLGGQTYIVEGHVGALTGSGRVQKTQPFRNISMRVEADGYVSNDGLDAWLGGSI